MSQWKTKVIEDSETIFFLAVFVQKARMLRWITQDFFFSLSHDAVPKTHV